MYEEENKYPSIFATPRGSQYSINVSQVFGSPYTFDEAIHILGVASPDDIIVFQINSDGGQLYSLIALQNAIRSSQAQIHMNLIGMAASAGGALFLTEGVSSYGVGDNTCLMIHNMLCGTGYDDTHKIVTRAEHNKKINDRFVRETYLNFLSETEIQSVLDGKEIYLEDYEIKARLEKRESLRESEYQKSLQQSLDDEMTLDIFTDEELAEELKLIQAEIKKRKRMIPSETKRDNIKHMTKKEVLGETK